MSAAGILPRIWQGDHTVWKPDPAEIGNRLGWLYSPQNMQTQVDEINHFCETARSAGFKQALLLGMGGSSLAPEVFQAIFGTRNGCLQLQVLDSTAPEVVEERRQWAEADKTLYIVATKSGGTVETISFMKYFYNQVLKKHGSEEAGKAFVAITDPGSGLEKMARRIGFGKIFLNDPDIGGRYSALSLFGLVPAALVGVDVSRLLDRAAAMAAESGSQGLHDGQSQASAAHLGAAMAVLACAGRDKLTLLAGPSLAPFGVWVEQLIAESTGKESKGILPVVGEALEDIGHYGSDRLVVTLSLPGQTRAEQEVFALVPDQTPLIRIRLEDRYDLGQEFFRWEMATIIAGHLLGINPFDQPNVESAKVRAREMMGVYQQEGQLPRVAPAFEAGGISVTGDVQADEQGQWLDRFLRQEQAGGKGDTTVFPRPYVALQAFLPPGPAVDAALAALRSQIMACFQLAVTVGYGPRFLHSTGQLHKGDGGLGLFIQLTADDRIDLDVPTEAGQDAIGFSFGVLKQSQVLGDYQALFDNKRRVIRLALGSEPVAGIEQITRMLQKK
jgi:glucose-6-phosphate isomerase